MPEDEISAHEHLDRCRDKLARVVPKWVGKPPNKCGADDYKAFAKFIGDPYDDVRFYFVDITKPRIREIIDALDGPHCAALLKVLEIRNGTK